LDQPRTLNRMEPGAGEKDRYKMIPYGKDAIDELLVKVFLEAHEKSPDEVVLYVDTTVLPLQGDREGRFLHGDYMSMAICRSMSSAANPCGARDCGHPTTRLPSDTWQRSGGSWGQSRPLGRK
jgi:hypothetical protein